MVKAVIYTRLSKKQTKDSFSLNVQEEKCREFANNLRVGKSTSGLNVTNVVREIASSYTLNKGKITSQNKHLNDISRKDKQTELLNILQTRKRGDYIIVARADRLSRNQNKLWNYLEIAKKRGLTIVVLRDHEPALFSNCEDDMKILYQLVHEANIESKNISQRVKATQEYKKKLYEREGCEPYNGKNIPYGKMVAKRIIQGNIIDVLIPQAHEQEMIARIHKLVKSMGIKQTVVQLNNSNLLCRGEKWTKKTICTAYRTKLSKLEQMFEDLANVKI